MTKSSKKYSAKLARVLKTHLNFDGLETQSNASSDALVVSQRFSITNSLLVQALIEQICWCIEDSPAKRILLFNEICRKFGESQFLDITIPHDELSQIRGQFGDALIRGIRAIHKQINCSPETLAPNTCLSLGNELYPTSSFFSFPDRYHQTFEELEVIAKGGFGVVCKVRHKVDGIVYAVKKIFFKYTNDLEFKKVIQEAKSIAALKHPNIVNYNHAWLGNHRCTESGESSSSTSSEGGCSPVKKHNTPRYIPVNIENETTSSSSSSILFCAENTKTNIDLLKCDLDKTETVTDDDKIETVSNDDKIETGTDDNKIKAIINTEILENAYFSEYENNVIANFQNEHTEKSTEIFNTYSSSITSQDFYVVDGERNYEYEIHEFSENVHSSVVNENNWSIYNQKDAYVTLINENTENIVHHRRRRHSSGATCSSADNEKERDNVTYTRPPYERHVSADDKNARALVPVTTAPNVEWDIRDLRIRATFYIQMEYCDSDLRTLLEQRAINATTNINPMNIFRQILLGLEHIHSKSIIHRDLKPKNIFLVKESGCVKIGDFGLATLVHHVDEHCLHCNCSTGSHTQGLGTLPYAAPEQRKGKNYDCKVDIYSVGIILLELLYPFKTSMELSEAIDQILEDKKVPRDIISEWPRHAELLAKLIHLEPKERPSASEILKLPIFKKEKFKVEAEAAVNTERISDLQNQLTEKDQQIEALKNSLKDYKETILLLEDQLRDRDIQIQQYFLKYGKM